MKTFLKSCLFFLPVEESTIMLSGVSSLFRATFNLSNMDEATDSIILVYTDLELQSVPTSRPINGKIFFSKAFKSIEIDFPSLTMCPLKLNKVSHVIQRHSTFDTLVHRPNHSVCDNQPWIFLKVYDRGKFL